MGGKIIKFEKTYLIFGLLFFGTYTFSQNPFLRPGSQKPKPVVVQRPAPPPPPPKPQNPSIELRGFFKFKGEWYFSLFDKSKNRGVWLQQGESFDDGKVEIQSFNPETEVLLMKGGITLSLKKSDGKVLSVPSAMPVKKAQPNKKPVSSGINSPRRIVTSGGRTITIPPRNPLPTPKNR